MTFRANFPHLTLMGNLVTAGEHEGVEGACLIMKDTVVFSTGALFEGRSALAAQQSLSG